jgi:SAM-dependent methyltransferase
MNRNDNVWEYYGEKDPYFGVTSVGEMRSEALDDAARADFFASGEEYISRVWQEIDENFEPGFTPARSLDFGCGVGRVAMPIARRSGHVTGFDISEGMLEEARKNAERSGIGNVDFMLADETLSRASGLFDFVHSFVVFQHIKPQTGMRLAQRLIDLLNEGGIGALHFQYANSMAKPQERLRFKLYRDVPGVYALRNLVLGKKKEPLMPMYSYELNKLMLMLQKSGCHKCQVRFSDHGVEGALILFRKREEKLY